MRLRILIVEDDLSNSRLMHFLLSDKGYQVDSVDNARGALAMVERQPPDLMLLDVNLPQLSGFEIYERLRDRNVDIPVIFVTAKGELEDRLQGLNMGADDYISKPFQPAELTARVEAVMRRYRKSVGSEQQHLRSGDLDIDVAALTVQLPDRRTAHLTPTEMKLLLQLAQHPAPALSRAVLMEGAWVESYGGERNSVGLDTRRLRRKIERDPTTPAVIQSARGIGYKFTKA